MIVVLIAGAILYLILTQRQPQPPTETPKEIEVVIKRGG